MISRILHFANDSTSHDFDTDYSEILFTKEGNRYATDLRFPASFDSTFIRTQLTVGHMPMGNPGKKATYVFRKMEVTKKAGCYTAEIRVFENITDGIGDIYTRKIQFKTKQKKGILKIVKAEV